jgi:hypothetical protein
MNKTKRVEYLAHLVIWSFLLFVVLKLTDVLDWSWWWITSPLWIAVLINVFAVFMVYVMLGVLRHIIVKASKKIEKEFNEE